GRCRVKNLEADLVALVAAREISPTETPVPEESRNGVRPQFCSRCKGELVWIHSTSELRNGWTEIVSTRPQAVGEREDRIDRKSVAEGRRVRDQGGGARSA